MIIEFAAPGYNWGFVWWPLLALAVAVTAFVLTSRTRYVDWDMGHWIPSILGPVMILAGVMVPVFAAGVQSSDYAIRVSIQKGLALSDSGFSNIVISGDRFTAATEDGEFYLGILVDLRPDSGYAYQVLEITDTPTK